MAEWAAGVVDPDWWGPRAQPLVLTARHLPATNAPAPADLVTSAFQTVLHAGGPGSHPAQDALLAALPPVPTSAELDIIGMVLGALTGPDHERLEVALSTAIRKEYPSAAQPYLAQGRAEGRAEDVLTVLAARGLEVSDTQQHLITSTTDLDTLSHWLRRAATANTTDELFS